jgi:hypothetical protein
MANRYRRILRAASVTAPDRVLLPEEKCTGQHFHELRSFCEERGLSLSRHGPTVVWDHNIYQVFMFATDQDAEIFRAASRVRASIHRRNDRQALVDLEKRNV